MDGPGARAAGIARAYRYRREWRRCCLAWRRSRSIRRLAGAQDATGQPAAEQQPGAEARQDASGATLLDKITVVSRTGETAIETLASVSHVDQEQLDRRMATTPLDIFFGVPGITVQSDAKRAGSSVNIRGLQDFGRVAVIVDGARQNFQRSGHGTQSMFWIDPELVKEVDVLRGPVANTYGSGAIGGVVVFETKDATDFLRPGETWAASTSGRYETNGDGWTTSATGAYRFNDAVDVLGNFVWRDYGDYKDGDGDEVAGTGFDVLSGLLKASVRPTENSELKLGWVGTYDSWTEGDGQLRPRSRPEHLHRPLPHHRRRAELARPAHQRVAQQGRASTRPISTT